MEWERQARVWKEPGSAAASEQKGTESSWGGKDSSPAPQLHPPAGIRQPGIGTAGAATQNQGFAGSWPGFASLWGLSAELDTVWLKSRVCLGKLGKIPRNSISGSSEGVMLLHPPASVPGRNLWPFPAFQGELPAPFPAPCGAFPSASAAGAKFPHPDSRNSHSYPERFPRQISEHKVRTDRTFPSQGIPGRKGHF